MKVYAISFYTIQIHNIGIAISEVEWHIKNIGLMSHIHISILSVHMILNEYFSDCHKDSHSTTLASQLN